MKKLISLILALTMVLCLSACGGGEAETTAPKANEPGYTFVANGTEIAMTANAASIVEALGEPKTYTEEASCAFEGLDKTYFYGSFFMTTYPVGEEDFVYSLWLVDDTLSTPEGICIGSSKADVEAAYGADGYNGTNGYVFTKGASKLTIILDGDTVSSIQYDAVVD